MAGVEERSIDSFDGTRIAYQVSSGKGPAIVLANGLGGSYSVWRHQYELFGEEHRVISWDYRGLFRSARPPSLDSLTIDNHARDLELILDAEAIDEAMLVSWSMGAQVAFEFCRRRPSACVGIVAINATPGRPLRSVFPRLDQLLQPLLMLNRWSAPFMQRGAQLAMAWQGLVPTLRRFGLVGQAIDEQLLQELAGEFTELDFEAYGETLRHLAEHDAAPAIAKVSVPTMLIAGSRDVVTSLAATQQLASALPNAQLVVVDGGTHYTAMESAEQVNQHIRQHLRKTGHCPLGVDEARQQDVSSATEAGA